MGDPALPPKPGEGPSQSLALDASAPTTWGSTGRMRWPASGTDWGAQPGPRRLLNLLLAAELAPTLGCPPPLAPAEARFSETRGILTVTGTPRRGPRLGRGLQEGLPPLGCDPRGAGAMQASALQRAGWLWAVAGSVAPFPVPSVPALGRGCDAG